MIHPNSTASYQDVLTELNGRHKMIFRAFHKTTSAKLTDREVKDKLGLEDLNMVRPRITELVQSGHLREVGDKKCDVTNKTVRMTSISPKAAVSRVVESN